MNIPPSSSIWSAFLSVALSFFAAFSPLSFAADAPCAPPQPSADGWAVATPQASGFDASALCALLADVATGKENVHSVVVERRGRLVAELYRTGLDIPITSFYGLWRPFASDIAFGPTTLHDARSVSKSVVSLLIGIALERGTQGKIKNLTTPVLDFFPELARLRTPERAAITLEHALTMTSGLQWDEAALPNDETRLFWKKSIAEFVLDRPLVDAPGQRFHYNSGGTALLADILVRATGMPLKTLARTQLFEPLGITDWDWVTDFHGRELAFTGLRLRPRDMTKLGRLLLNRGQWQGRQIVSAQWIVASTRPNVAAGFPPRTGTANPSHYGYQWRVGSVDWKGRPLAWAAAFGNGGQRIFVVPELDLTLVVTAGDYGSASIVTYTNQLLARVVATVRD
jgi:CubicO group peptidase (beta-lactamase class C family)